jgi:hypothetical protein
MNEERFVKNINFLMLKYILVCDVDAKRLFENIVKHFPNHREELEHYCFILNFGKCGDEYESPEEL